MRPWCRGCLSRDRGSKTDSSSVSEVILHTKKEEYGSWQQRRVPARGRGPGALVGSCSAVRQHLCSGERRGLTPRCGSSHKGVLAANQMTRPLIRSSTRSFPPSFIPLLFLEYPRCARYRSSPGDGWCPRWTRAFPQGVTAPYFIDSKLHPFFHFLTSWQSECILSGWLAIV